MQTELKRREDEVLRKIGKNVMLFQQVEHLLKGLVTGAGVAGYPGAVEAGQQRRAAGVGKQTMGQVAAAFGDDILGNPTAPPGPADSVNEGWLSLRFTIDCGDRREARLDALRELVAERNELVHHMVARWDPRSLASTAAAEDYLDRQREKILPVLEELRADARIIDEMRRNLAEGYAPGGALRALILYGGPLLSWLLQFADLGAGSDGWVNLGRAEHFARVEVPNEIARLQEKYGQKTLGQFVSAAGLFETREEPTAKGGTRTLFRLRLGVAVESGSTQVSVSFQPGSIGSEPT
jgi:hypothetical protein